MAILVVRRITRRLHSDGRLRRPPVKRVTLLRHDVALNMKLFHSMLEMGPPVPPGEPRGLNKERP